MGNITKEIELKYTSTGMAIAKFSIAINRKWKNEAGELKEEATFLELGAFGKTAENIAQYFKKGSPIFVESRARLEQWDDKQTGQKRQKVSFVVDSFQFVGGNKEASQSPRQTRPAPSDAQPDAPNDANVDDDSVPF